MVNVVAKRVWEEKLLHLELLSSKLDFCVLQGQREKARLMGSKTQIRVLGKHYGGLTR